MKQLSDIEIAQSVPPLPVAQIAAGLGLSEDEIEFWTEVFETHRSVMGTSSKPKSRNQIVKWLKNPHSDSAEYKMWGNGVALPNVYFVLSGIVYYAQFPEG